MAEEESAEDVLRREEDESLVVSDIKVFMQLDDTEKLFLLYYGDWSRMVGPVDMGAICREMNGIFRRVHHALVIYIVNQYARPVESRIRPLIDDSLTTTIRTIPETYFESFIKTLTRGEARPAIHDRNAPLYTGCLAYITDVCAAINASYRTKIDLCLIDLDRTAASGKSPFLNLISHLAMQLSALITDDYDQDSMVNFIVFSELVIFGNVYYRASTLFCQLCGKRASMMCGKCFSTRYCSEECQKRDWPSHKPSCMHDDYDPAALGLKEYVRATIDGTREKDANGVGTYEKLAKVIARYSPGGASPNWVPQYNFNNRGFDPSAIKDMSIALLSLWNSPEVRPVSSYTPARNVVREIGEAWKPMLQSMHSVFSKSIIYQKKTIEPWEMDRVRKIESLAFEYFYESYFLDHFCDAVFPDPTKGKSFFSIIVGYISDLTKAVDKIYNIRDGELAVSGMSLFKEAIDLIVAGRVVLDYAKNAKWREGVVTYADLLSYAKLYWWTAREQCVNCCFPGGERCGGCGHHVFCKLGKGRDPRVGCKFKAAEFHQEACAMTVFPGKDKVKDAVKDMIKSLTEGKVGVNGMYEKICRTMVVGSA